MNKVQELMMYHGEELQEATNILQRERHSDGSRPETRHAIQVAQAHALMAVALAVSALVSKDTEAEIAQTKCNLLRSTLGALVDTFDRGDKNTDDESEAVAIARAMLNSTIQ